MGAGAEGGASPGLEPFVVGGRADGRHRRDAIDGNCGNACFTLVYHFLKAEKPFSQNIGLGIPEASSFRQKLLGPVMSLGADFLYSKILI